VTLTSVANTVSCSAAVSMIAATVLSSGGVRYGLRATRKPRMPGEGSAYRPLPGRCGAERAANRLARSRFHESEATMAIGVYFSPESFPVDKYDSTLKDLEDAGAGAPVGRLYHCAMESPGGGPRLRRVGVEGDVRGVRRHTAADSGGSRGRPGRADDQRGSQRDRWVDGSIWRAAAPRRAKRKRRAGGEFRRRALAVRAIRARRDCSRPTQTASG
jgi:hypothetical protein